MLCSEIMTTVVECATRRETIESVAGRMRDANVSFLPVCDEEGRVVGTITERDIVVKLVANDMAARTPAGAVMTPTLVACRPDEAVERAAHLMRRAHTSSILCLDEQGHLAGVVSLAQLRDKTRAWDAAHSPH
jgi:CBS domain-containing protein